MDNKEEITFKSGAKSSREPRFELIPYEGSVRIARRFELGIERKGEASWNALSSQTPLTDMEFIMSRLGHVVNHAKKLQAIINGEIPDDGDDHAAAIGWSGYFLCSVTRALTEKAITRAKSRKRRG